MFEYCGSKKSIFEREGEREYCFRTHLPDTMTVVLPQMRRQLIFLSTFKIQLKGTVTRDIEGTSLAKFNRR
jgi:hypothetical protein